METARGRWFTRGAACVKLQVDCLGVGVKIELDHGPITAPSTSALGQKPTPGSKEFDKKPEQRLLRHDAESELPRDFIDHIVGELRDYTLGDARDYRRNRPDCFQFRVARLGGSSRSF